jgi:hypothetical protein
MKKSILVLELLGLWFSGIYALIRSGDFMQYLNDRLSSPISSSGAFPTSDPWVDPYYYLKLNLYFLLYILVIIITIVALRHLLLKLNLVESISLKKLAQVIAFVLIGFLLSMIFGLLIMIICLVVTLLLFSFVGIIDISAVFGKKFHKLNKYYVK